MKHGRAYRIYCAPRQLKNSSFQSATFARLTIVSMELEHRFHNPFFHTSSLPNPHITIRATGPDLITYQVHTKPLICSRIPPCQPGQFPPSTPDVPYPDAVASAFNDAQIPPAGAPEELGDACPLLFLSVVDGRVVDGEDGNGVAVAGRVVETHAACESSSG